MECNSIIPLKLLLCKIDLEADQDARKENTKIG
jgi:hypothetical protein